MRNYVGTALDLHEDGLCVGHGVPVRQAGRPAPHHAVNLGLNAALHLGLARHVEQAPGQRVGRQQALEIIEK
jgi:hypothetical protein